MALPDRALTFSHGVEQELQIVDASGCLVHGRRAEVETAVSASLRSHAFAGYGPDAFSSQFEYWVGIMPDLGRLEHFLRDFRSASVNGARKVGLRVLACGANPLADTPDGENFGEHHHVGVQSAREAVLYHDMVRQFVPEFIALSANSRFLSGRASGFASARLARSKVCGLPPRLGSSDVDRVRLSSKRRSGGGRLRYWDVTPFVKAGRTTVEVRLFDVMPRIRRTVAVAGLLQALLFQLRQDKRLEVVLWGDPTPDAEEQIAANRARAVKYGAAAELDLTMRPVLPGRRAERAIEAARRLVEWLSPAFAVLARLQAAGSFVDDLRAAILGEIDLAEAEAQSIPVDARAAATAMIEATERG